jgi:hypothetical protein
MIADDLLGLKKERKGEERRGTERKGEERKSSQSKVSEITKPNETKKI